MRVAPLIFAGPNIRALLREIEQPGTGKTMTRRVLKPQPEQAVDGWDWCWTPPGYPKRHLERFWWRDDSAPGSAVNRYLPHKPGDLLWCRETWAIDGPITEARARHEDAMCGDGIGGYGPYYKATEVAPETLSWRSPIHMPRWASRLTLEVTAAKIERVQDISAEDAIAEGIERLQSGRGYYDPRHGHGAVHARYFTSAREAFVAVWDDIHGPDSWDSNPWVACYTLKPVLANVDEWLGERKQ